MSRLQVQSARQLHPDDFNQVLQAYYSALNPETRGALLTEIVLRGSVDDLRNALKYTVVLTFPDSPLNSLIENNLEDDYLSNSQLLRKIDLLLPVTSEEDIFQAIYEIPGSDYYFLKMLGELFRRGHVFSMDELKSLVIKGHVSACVQYNLTTSGARLDNDGIATLIMEYLMYPVVDWDVLKALDQMMDLDAPCSVTTEKLVTEIVKRQPLNSVLFAIENYLFSYWINEGTVKETAGQYYLEAKKNGRIKLAQVLKIIYGL
jgi:hypothetical protein